MESARVTWRELGVGLPELLESTLVEYMNVIGALAPILEREAQAIEDARSG